MVTTPKKVSATAANDGENEEVSREPQVSASASNDGGDEDISREPEHHPTREERLYKHRMHCQNLAAYLTTNVCPAGLSKKEVRNIKNQAKTHQFDSKSKMFAIDA